MDLRNSKNVKSSYYSAIQCATEYGQKVSGQKVLCIPGQKVLGIGQKVFYIYATYTFVLYTCVCYSKYAKSVNTRIY